MLSGRSTAAGSSRPVSSGASSGVGPARIQELTQMFDSSGRPLHPANFSDARQRSTSREPRASSTEPPPRGFSTERRDRSESRERRGLSVERVQRLQEIAAAAERQPVTPSARTVSASADVAMNDSWSSAAQSASWGRAQAEPSAPRRPQPAMQQAAPSRTPMQRSSSRPLQVDVRGGSVSDLGPARQQYAAGSPMAAAAARRRPASAGHLRRASSETGGTIRGAKYETRREPTAYESSPTRNSGSRQNFRRSAP